MVEDEEGVVTWALVVINLVELEESAMDGFLGIYLSRGKF